MRNIFLNLINGGKFDPNDKASREKCGAASGVIGVLTNLVLATLKLIAGLLSGSIAVTADALNNFSDAGSSIITFISFKISSKPADRDHPFGHARFEYVSSMIVSFLILLVGFELLAESVTGFFQEVHEAIKVSTITIIILSVSVLMKLLLGCFYLSVSKKISSSVIRASATDSFMDAISTLAVLASTIIIHLTDIWFIDGIVGIAVSILVLLAGIKILNETKNSLLGEAPVDEVIENINAIVSKYPEVLGIHDMLVHNYGPKNYIASFHAEVNGDEDVYMLHDKIDNIEREISTTLGILCTIHMDPIVTNDETVNELREFTKASVANIFPQFTVHDFRTVIGNTHTNLIFDIVVPFEYKGDIEDLKAKIEAEIKKARPECFCVITVDRG